ncbi:MAG: hypothetical protein FWD68_08775 [Alphaproteobacteria bacterium]|nr:hypothetical protein [Alphaproteobacteria bacterium]
MTKSFRDDRSEPEPHPPNPGQGSKGRIEFSSNGKEWTEDINLVAVLRGLPAKGTFGCNEQGDRLVSKGGRWHKPQIVLFDPRDDGLVKTCTTIELAHPSVLSQPCFEFKHSAGERVTAAVRRGFEESAQIDWAVFGQLAADQPAPGLAGRDQRGTATPQPSRTI